jgi:23S rRNA (guanosine2251-2'-O)-methyltransferase
MARKDENAMEMIYGIHPVQELMHRRPGAVERIFVASRRGAGIGRILRQAREAGVPVTNLPKELLAKKAGARAVHQGIVAQVAPAPYADVEEICHRAMARKNAIVVVLDRVVDAGNLGSIIRTCCAAGVDGLILGSEGTAGLSAGAAKASAGAIERLPVGREARLGRRLEDLRNRGFRTLALDPRGEESWDEVDLKPPLVLVAGGEERGIRPSVRRACESSVAIPMARKFDSLNVAVSLGVLLFEALRQRRSMLGGLETSESR